jgi:putative hydrolase of HD superfamily
VSKEIKKIVELIHTAGELKKIKRTGWGYRGIKDGESVADHSYRTTIITMLLGKNLGLNEEKLLKISLIHDLAEAKVGDLVVDGKGPKYDTTKEKKHELEVKAIKEILVGLSDYEEYLSLWNEYEDKSTPEARIVAEIDKLEMAFQAIEYEKEGRTKIPLDEFLATAKKGITNPLLKQIIEELEKEREKTKLNKN